MQPILDRNNGVFTAPPGDTPSTKLVDGPLMGNGDVLATMAGAASAQTIYISKNDFWNDPGSPSTSATVPLPVGGVKVSIPGLSSASYSNVQDIDQGRVVSTFTTGATTITMVTWVSADENLVFATLSSATGGTNQSVTVETYAPTNSGLSTSQTAGKSGDQFWATRATNPAGRSVSRAAIVTRILGATYTPATNGSTSSTAGFTLTPGGSVTIVSAVGGGKSSTAAAALSAAQTRVGQITPAVFTTLLASHETWWKNYWTKSFIDLGGGVVERYWYGAQYALGASNRSGKTAPGLWAWNTTDTPNWNGDLHLNYNAESPYYGVHSSNRSDLSAAYRSAILAAVPEGQSNTSVVSPAYNGVYLKVGITPFGYTSDDHFYGQKVNAVWAALDFAQTYDYTLDTTYLQNYTYPFLKQVGAFWSDSRNLACDGGTGSACTGGRWVVTGSQPYEYNPGDNLFDTNSTSDLALIKYLFKSLIKASVALGVDAGLRPQWQAYVDRLSTYPTTAQNGKTVFRVSENTPGGSAGGIWNLAPLTPTGDVGLGSSPAVLQIARDTVLENGTWDQGNSFQNVYPAAVRAGIADSYSRMESYLTTAAAEHSALRNNLTVSQAGGGIETFGATVAVNDMLMQSHDDVIRLFPVWPTARNASFSTLRAKGAFLVSAAITGGVIGDVDITSEKGQSLTVLNPWTAAPTITDLTTNTAVTFSTSGSLLTFATTSGHAYRLHSNDPAGNANLAIGATATASTSDTPSGYAPGKINDNVITTSGAGSWSSDGTSAMPQWVQLEWSSARTFNQADLYTTSGYELNQYSIQWWNAATSTWVDCFTPVTGNTSTHRTHLFTPVTTTKVRVFATTGSVAQPGTARVNELQIFNRQNLALAANATASSTDPGYAPGGANDNVISAGGGINSWSNNSGQAFPQWVELAWSTNRTFQQIELYTTAGLEISAYKLQYWNAPTSAWVDIVSVSSNTNTHNTYFFSPVTSTKVRVLASSGSASQPSIARVNELQVFGT